MINRLVGAVLIFLFASVIAAQVTYTTEDGVLSVILPSGWVATEDDFQMFITNRAGITANILEAGDVAISIVRPRLLRELVGNPRATSADVIAFLTLLATQEGENLGQVISTELGSYLTDSFSYRISRTGNDAQFMAVDTGSQIVAVQVVASAGEMAQFSDEIREVILSLRVNDVAIGGKSLK